MRTKSKKSNIPSFFGETLGALIGWYILTHISGWNFSWITEGYLQWLPIALFALGVDYVCDIARILWQKQPVRHLCKIVANLANFASTVMFLKIFPFQFPDSYAFIALVFKFALVISLVVMLIESTVRLFQFFAQLFGSSIAADCQKKD